MDKGTFANVVSASVFGVGLLLQKSVFQEFVLSIGLFAFSGGITNSLAVKMLFDRIPGLVGSGVIPARFKEIRSKVKSLILDHFFDQEYLRRFFSGQDRKVDWKRYMKTSTSAKAPLAAYVEAQWEKVAAPAVVQPIIDQQIEKLMDSSVGGLLMMVGPDAVKPAVTQFVGSFLNAMKSKVVEVAARPELPEPQIEIDEERIVADIRANVEELLARKLEDLDPMTVKRMMEDVIRNHLGWLVVWGSVFGAVLGIPPVLIKLYFS